MSPEREPDPVPVDPKPAPPALSLEDRIGGGIASMAWRIEALEDAERLAARLRRQAEPHLRAFAEAGVEDVPPAYWPVILKLQRDARRALAGPPKRSTLLGQD